MNTTELKLVRELPLFANLPEELFGGLTATAQSRTYPKGRMIFQRGDKADYFYVVLDGWVKVFRETPDGDEALLNIFSRGDLIAEAAGFMGASYPASAEVVDDCRLVALESRRFVNMVKRNPEMALNMLASVSRHMHYLVYEVECLKTRSASQRLTEFILRHCRVDSGPYEVKLPYDKNLIATRLGIQPQSLSRLLGRLREYGVTTEQDTVFIEDVEKLSEVFPSDFDLDEQTVA